MKTWTDVEKIFQDAGISYQQKDWIFFCEINEGKFYYSPQSGKWRVKRTRAWQFSNSVEDFVAQAKEYLLLENESKQSPKSNQKSDKKKSGKKKKSRKTKASSSSHQDHKQNTRKPVDEVRSQFLELFDEKMKVCAERDYKPAWIWLSLLDQYLLTPPEICWLCTVFDYSPGWAFHQAKDEYPSLTYQDILLLIGDNRTQWLNYFNSRWQFTSGNGEKQPDHEQRRQQHKQQRSQPTSPQSDYRSNQYQHHLNILQLNFPFSKQELKTAYRRKALETHPDTGGTSEAFRRVHIAFGILSQLAS